MILVDTPGLGAALRDDEISGRLGNWLKKSLPPGSRRKLAIVYMLEINQRATADQQLLRKWCGRRISGYLVIATTKRNLKSEQAGHEHMSKIYAHDTCSFHDTQASAWGIINSICDSPIDVSDFVFALADTRHNATSPVRSATMPTWPALLRGRASNRGDDKSSRESSRASSCRPSVLPLPLMREPSVEKDVSRGSSIIARLEEFRTRLTPVFLDETRYKRLLSCRGREAQALLDLFQLILRTNPSDARFRRNLIMATKRLSSKTDLFPSLFNLANVQRSNKQAVASGAYADIYQGLFQGECVCLKVIRMTQTSTYSRIAKAIAREAIVWGQLSHPNLLPFYGLYRVEQELCLVSPWAKNESMINFLKTKPDASTRLLLCSDIASGIAYLHDNNIVHGDLKGLNILVDAVPRGYLGDFGLSSVEDPDILFWASQSGAASSGGTVRYQAPEIFGNEDTPPAKNSPATDVYAWAYVCYEIFTGLVPFSGYPDHFVMMQVTKGARPTLPVKTKEQYRAWGLTDDIWALINECWEHDQTNRPKSSEVISRLAKMKPADHRLPGEWRAGPAMHQEGLSDCDIPLTLDYFDEVLSQESPTQ